MNDAFTTHTVTVNAGRTLGAHVAGDPASQRVVVVCHPAPGSGRFDPDPELTSVRDVALIAVDRPGYGASDPLPSQEWPSVRGAAEDTLAVLDSLGVEAFGVAGWSAGGRVALALAASAPDRVDRVAVAGTPAPDDQVPWLSEEIRAGIEALKGLSAADARSALETQLGFATAEMGVQLLGASPPDEPTLASDGLQRRLQRMLAVAFEQGVTGMAADIASYCLRPYGFEPSAVAAKALLVYGSADPIAGPRHGTWWQRQLPNARYEQVPGAGHFVFVQMWKRILAHLAPQR